LSNLNNTLQASLRSNIKSDFRNPFVRVTIITADGIRFPLWTGLGISDEVRQKAHLADLTALPFVRDVSIELQLGYIPIIKATLAMPYKDAINFLNSRLIEWGHSTLEVVFGYASSGGSSGELSPPLSGIILQPQIQMGIETVITLNAQGVGGFAMQGTAAGGKSFSDKSRQELIEIYAKGLNETIQRNITVNFDAVQPNSTARQLLDAKEDFNGIGKTEWNCAFEIARNAQCWLSLIGNELRVIPKFYFANPPTRVMRLYHLNGGQISSELNEYPILTCSTSNTAIYLPSVALGSAIVSQNSADPKQIESVAISDFTNSFTNPGSYTQSNTNNAQSIPSSGPGSSAPAASSNTPTANFDTKTGLQWVVGDKNDPKTLQEAITEYNSYYANIGIYLDITTVGIPNLMPAENIIVRGLGSRMDQVNYGIYKIVHDIGSNGFTTSINTISNVMGKHAEGIIGATVDAVPQRSSQTAQNKLSTEAANNKNQPTTEGLQQQLKEAEEKRQKVDTALADAKKLLDRKDIKDASPNNKKAMKVKLELRSQLESVGATTEQLEALGLIQV